jgi:hypothetical protein
MPNDLFAAFGDAYAKINPGAAIVAMPDVEGPEESPSDRALDILKAIDNRELLGRPIAVDITDDGGFGASGAGFVLGFITPASIFGLAIFGAVTGVGSINSGTADGPFVTLFRTNGVDFYSLAGVALPVLGAIPAIALSTEAQRRWSARRESDTRRQKLNLPPLDRKYGVSAVGILTLLGVTGLLMAPGVRCVYFESIGDRIVVDAQAQTISIGEQYLIRSSESQIIPFGDVFEIVYTREKALGELTGQDSPPGANVNLSLRSSREVISLRPGSQEIRSPLRKNCPR